jgi:hypothetical protein
MGLDDYLETARVLDCTGKVTHELTLLPDGMVRVRRSGGPDVIINPVTRTALTPGIHVPETLMDTAALLARV